MLRMHRTTLLLMLVAALTIIPANAIVYDITSDHCSGNDGCLTTPTGGTVTLTQQGANNVLVSIQLASYLRFVATGLQETIDFNLVGQPTISVSNFSNTHFFLENPSGAANTTGYHFDGIGDFEYAINLDTANGAGGSQPGTLSFLVTAAGLTESSFATLGTAPGTTIAFFGIDVYNTVNGNTGPVDASTSVPEPTAVLLFGTVLAGVGLWLRKRVGVNV